jgi:hypothetical protein
MAFSSRSSRHEYLLAALEIPVYRQTVPRLEAELRRARRYERPLSMLVLGAEPIRRKVHLSWGGEAAVPVTAEVEPVLFAFLGGFLRSSLRETDLLASVPESLRYVAFLPEVDGDGAEEAAGRLRADFFELASVHLRAGIAEFPRDGFTIADLFQNASGESNAQRREIPSLKQDGSNA